MTDSISRLQEHNLYDVETYAHLNGSVQVEVLLKVSTHPCHVHERYCSQ